MTGGGSQGSHRGWENLGERRQNEVEQGEGNRLLRMLIYENGDGGTSTNEDFTLGRTPVDDRRTWKDEEAEKAPAECGELRMLALVIV